MSEDTRRIDRLVESVGGMAGKFDGLATCVKGLDAKVDGLSDDLRKHMVDEEKRIDEQIATFKTTMSAFGRSIEAGVERISGCETQIEAFKVDIDGQQTERREAKGAFDRRMNRWLLIAKIAIGAIVPAALIGGFIANVLGLVP